LDPEHKRMFMAMKREVLRLGGYACEFFVSQTPELTGMADRIIDLEGYDCAGCGGGCMTEGSKRPVVPLATERRRVPVNVA
jgi:exonuclease SbcC